MNTRLVDQLRDVMPRTAQRHGPACESSLRVAAATLAHDTHRDVTATRVVGTLGRDDVDEFEALVTEIAEEYDLDSRLEIRGASFAVRFSRG